MVNLLLRGNVYSVFVFMLLSAFAWFVPTASITADYVFLGTNLPVYVAISIGFVINLIASVVLNTALSKQFFSNENSIAVMLFYMLLTALSTNISQLVGLSLLLFVFVLFVFLILGMREDENRVKNIFNSSILLGVLSIMNIFLLPFIYLIFSGINGVRRVVLKDVFTILVAILTPLYLIWAFSFIGDEYQFLNTRLQFNFILPTVSVGFIIGASLLFLLAVIGIFTLKNNRLVFGTKILRVSNTLIFLFIISYALGVLGMFFGVIGGYFAWVASANAIFISTLFLKIDFKFKDALLVAFVLFVIGLKFLI